jgi:hypothetical protein
MDDDNSPVAVWSRVSSVGPTATDGPRVTIQNFSVLSFSTARPQSGVVQDDTRS